MPDEPLVVRGIDWKSTFPFTLIFRSFRVAIHPSKLVLALLALLLIYLGGRILDGIWPANSLAVPNELALYSSTRAQTNSAQDFKTRRLAVRNQIIEAHKQRLAAIDKTPENGSLADIKAKIIEVRDNESQNARKLFDEAPPEVKAANPEMATARDGTIAEIYRTARLRYAEADDINGEGLFMSLIRHQIGTSGLIFGAGVAGNWLAPGGALDRFVDLLTVAPGWAFRHHPVYFTLFGVYFLIVWAIFGGAIARIAAVQVARDEKISFRQALSFSTAKFLSFVSAPIIPLLIIVFIGLIVTLGGLLFNIPFVGPIVAGALFFLALAAGFIMTLVLLGLLGGFNLMYPTVAVEGSDSFDAISRSFSYLFARPWRLIFYTLVAVVYGTLCYAFVRYFILLMLWITHAFVGLGVWRDAPSTEPLLPVMWPNPLTAPSLSFSPDHLTLNAGDDIGAMFMSIWIHLVIAVLGAFAISFYFSANTIIYMLMRHEVDATEMDDVYLEQSEDDFTETTTTPAESMPTASQSGESPSTPPQESGSP